jgi:hypothetical protein
MYDTHAEYDTDSDDRASRYRRIRRLMKPFGWNGPGTEKQIQQRYNAGTRSKINRDALSGATAKPESKKQ